MGKAARTKRDRREGGPDGAPRTVVAHEPKRQLPVFWIVIGVLLLGGIVALVATRPSDSDSAATKAAQGAPAFAEVEVTGDQVPAFTTGDDPAVGEQLPTIAGTSTDDGPIRLDAADGAQVIVTLAHWCPHCQAEVPRIVDWAKDGGLPDGVKIT
ncbi:MAG: hypothetical protein JWM25_1495, partial [Thermoleophilia bacterium]|nr:hypothetical protein [Thermoleophilia bacterium]